MLTLETSESTTMSTNISTSTQPKLTEPKPMGIMAAIANKTIPKHTPLFAKNNAYTLAEHKEFVEKLDLGQVTAEELKEIFERVVGCELNLKAELTALKVTQLKDMLSGSFYRSEKKDYLIEKAYNHILMDFSLSEVFSHQPFSETYTDAMRRQVLKVTDEQIQQRAKKILERQEFFEKALTKPETKEEFKIFIGYNGIDKLSTEQKILLDKLNADATLSNKEQELAQKAIVSKVNLGDVKLELIEHFHTHRGHNVFIVTMSERVEREVYEELCKKARQLGGNYSKPWRDKSTGSVSPGGFMFNDKQDGEKFIQLKDGNVSRLDDFKAHQEEVKQNAVEHLQEMAESLTQEAKESQSIDRKVNTERRARFARNAEKEAYENLLIAETLQNIAEAISNKEIKYLSNVRAKTHIETLEHLFGCTKWQKAKKENKRYEDIKDDDPIADDVELVEYPYPTLHYSHLREVSNIKKVKGTTLIVKRLAKLFKQEDKDKGYITIKNTYLIDDIKKLVSKIKPFDKTLAEYMADRYTHYERLQVMGLANLPTLRTALREYLSYRGNQKKLDPIKEMERALIGAKIDGYFPTPRPIVEQMLEIADIKADMSVLEPNAGKGNIADLIREYYPEARLSVIEINSRLREILVAKGHNLVGWNFLEHQQTYDRVLMNPPFEDHQDAIHVKYAFSLLNPGGKVVAIMGEGAFFRMDKESISFREWLESLDGTSEKLPQGSFLDSERSTGVATRLVTINKPSSISTDYSTETSILPDKDSEFLPNEAEGNFPESPNNLSSQESEPVAAAEIISEAITETQEDTQDETILEAAVQETKLLSSAKVKPINLASLEKAAKTLEANATRVLSVNRQTNTARRAAMAENTEGNAIRDLELSKSIFRLVEAIKSGETTYLSNIRSKTQVELLEYLIRRAKNNRSSKLRQPEWESKNRAIEIEDIDYAEYPYPWIDRYTLKELSALSEGIVGFSRSLTELNTLLSPQLKLGTDYAYLNSKELLSLVKAIVEQLKSSFKSNAHSVAETICSKMQDYLKLSQIGVTDLPSLIDALKEYFFYRGEVKADPVKKLERELVGVKIRNYFPTPKHLIEKMLSLADIEPKMSVLEPSAGGGHIADEIKKQSPQCYLSVIEINYSLQEILKAKRYNLVATDFLEHRENYSRIIMNPPFDQDIEHVQHAYSLLYPKGKMVSIMSEGAFFRTDKKSIQFREWLESVGGYSEKLPDGSFLSGDRPTAVTTRLVVISKSVVNINITDLCIDITNSNSMNTTKELSENSINEVKETISEPSKDLLSQESKFDVVIEVINQTIESLEKDIEDIAIVTVSAVESELKQDISQTLTVDQYQAIKQTFLQHEQNYNSIMMNLNLIDSPLDGRKCLDHIYHGYSLLIPNGTLVAVIAEATFGYMNKEFTKFRNWVKSINGTAEKSEGNYLIVISKNTLF